MRRAQRLLHKTRCTTHAALITEVGRIEQLKVPRDREGTFLTEVFERYMPNDRSVDMTGSFEEAVLEMYLLEMYLQGISTLKIKRVTGKLSSAEISKDAVSRTAGRLGEELDAWRSRTLTRGRTLPRTYPYLYLDATFLQAIWVGAVRAASVRQELSEEPPGAPVEASDA